MNKEMNKVWRMIFLITQIGITMLTTIFLCLGIGYLVDKVFGTSLMVWFIIIGVIAGFKSVYILISKFISYDVKKTEDEFGYNNTKNMVYKDIDNAEDCEEDDFRDI